MKKLILTLSIILSLSNAYSQVLDSIDATGKLPFTPVYYDSVTGLYKATVMGEVIVSIDSTFWVREGNFNASIGFTLAEQELINSNRLQMNDTLTVVEILSKLETDAKNGIFATYFPVFDVGAKTSRQLHALGFETAFNLFPVNGINYGYYIISWSKDHIIRYHILPL